MEQTMIGGIADYFLACPLLKDGVFRIDALGNKPIEYAITTDVFDPVVKTYVNGDEERIFQFSFTSREFYSMDRLQSIANSAFYEELAEWIRVQDVAENYPEFPEGCTVQEMRALSSGYVMDISMQNARYQIQIQIDYYKEA